MENETSEINRNKKLLKYFADESVMRWFLHQKGHQLIPSSDSCNSQPSKVWSLRSCLHNNSGVCHLDLAVSWTKLSTKMIFSISLIFMGISYWSTSAITFWKLSWGHLHTVFLLQRCTVACWNAVTLKIYKCCFNIKCFICWISIFDIICILSSRRSVYPSYCRAVILWKI